MALDEILVSLPGSWLLIQPQTETEWNAYYDLRYEVLRKPWNQERNTTKDEQENYSLHFLMMNEKKQALATGRLQLNTDYEGQIRSMAVREGYRGKGLGCLMIKKLESAALEKGLRKIVLDARESAVDFYLKNDYLITGDSYLLFGEIKHFRMEKTLIPN